MALALVGCLALDGVPMRFLSSHHPNITAVPVGFHSWAAPASANPLWNQWDDLNITGIVMAILHRLGRQGAGYDACLGRPPRHVAEVARWPGPG